MNNLYEERTMYTLLYRTFELKLSVYGRRTV